MFTIGEKLPWVHEAVTAIIEIAPGGSAKEGTESGTRKKAIGEYVKAIEKKWQGSFGKQHVLERKAIAKKIRKGIESYHKFVQRNAKRLNLSKRELVLKWQKLDEVNVLLDLKKPCSNPEDFREKDCIFYYQQKDSSRQGYVTTQIEGHFASVESGDLDNLEEDQPELPMEIDKENNDPDYVINEIEDESALDISLRQTRSGTKIIIPEIYPLDQTSFTPKLRKNRNCTDAIKSTVSKVSYKCGISIEKARRAVQIVCKELYSHEFYLSLKEKDPQAECTKKEQDEDSKRGITDIDYKLYADIIPSAKSIRNYKGLQATQEEISAALTLYQKKADHNITFHFDTTSRSCIDGEWPALILNFSTGERYNLRPVFFAFEDRENISNLIAETYKRLAVAAAAKLGVDIEPKDLWENTDNIMTDSVTKNLDIEVLIAEKLDSTHIPKHLLCNAHVVEMFDKTNLKVLAEIEQKLNLRHRLETINPALRPFFRGKDAVVLAGIDALLKLVTHEHSGKSVSLAEEFDHLLHEQGLAKHMSLYTERRFTKLGYCAASILQAMPQLQQILAETWKSNLLIEACKLYADCDLFLLELHLLALFTKKVTLPFLNALETLSQKDLVEMFPRLYRDLMNHQTDSLKDFLVTYNHVKVEDATNEAEDKILSLMCEEAAKGLEMQRGREYGFGSKYQARKTTELHKLSDTEISKIKVVHNIDCERLLATFSHRANIAKFRNKNFTATGIRDDLVLAGANQSIIDRTTRAISKILKKKESEWTQQQKLLQRERLEKKIGNTQRSIYTKKLLQTCKTWGGPVATPNELECAINQYPVLAEKL